MSTTPPIAIEPLVSDEELVSESDVLAAESSPLPDSHAAVTVRLGAAPVVCPSASATPEEDEEPIPETLRSSVLADVREPVSRPIIVIDESDHRAA
ncbi:MAG TPA: hypothetical protein VM580_13745 [Labilithrix sp.]|jgi:hypothetical protein|nr:hypothetical protein [Labilithrix sp.]